MGVRLRASCSTVRDAVLAPSAEESLGPPSMRGLSRTLQAGQQDELVGSAARVAGDGQSAGWEGRGKSQFKCTRSLAKPSF